MKEFIKGVLKNNLPGFVFSSAEEAQILALGSLLTKQQLLMNSTDLNDYEFKIFSQFGDDGIIQYLIKNVNIINDVFIEFGVQNYLESNTRFLMMNNNWKGFVMDGSTSAINSLKKRRWYWKYDLIHKSIFIDRDNINSLLKETGFENIGLLHIDLDGNDYYIFEEIDICSLNPSIIILEYNSVFGKDRFISVPYDKKFDRQKAHYSNLFFGASLPALTHLADQKGYSLVGSNLAGNNAYYVRKDLLNDLVKEQSVEQVFRVSKFRESRNKDNSHSYLRGKERLDLIKGLNVINVLTGEREQL